MSISRGLFVPFLAIICSVVCLNLGTLWARHSLFPMVGSQGTTALRVGLSALVVVLIARPWRRLPSRVDLATIAGYGTALATMNLLFYMSLKTLPLGLAVAIEFSGPLAVSVFSSRRPLDVLWVLLAIVGLYTLLPLGSTGAGVDALDPAGVLYALAAAACWAVYIVLAKRVQHLPTGQSVALGLAVAAVIVLPFGAIEAGTAMLSFPALAIGLAVAVLSSAIPISLEMFALHRMPRHVFGVMLSMEPAVAALMALVLFGEQLTGPQWFAIGLIVSASVGSAIAARRPAH